MTSLQSGCTPPFNYRGWGCSWPNAKAKSDLEKALISNLIEDVVYPSFAPLPSFCFEALGGQSVKCRCECNRARERCGRPPPNQNLHLSTPPSPQLSYNHASFITNLSNRDRILRHRNAMPFPTRVRSRILLANRSRVASRDSRRKCSHVT